MTLIVLSSNPFGVVQPVRARDVRLGTSLDNSNRGQSTVIRTPEILREVRDWKNTFTSVY
jgi:hypothetical protein